MAAVQLRQREIEQAVVVLIDQTAALLVHVPVLAADAKRRTHLRCRALDHVQRRLRLRRDRRRHATLENRGLLGGDLLDGVAEKFEMIHRHRRDRAGERRVDHVGRVEPAAETDLEQQHIGRMPRKQKERRGGLDLEHRDRLRAVGALAFQQHIGQRLVAHQLAAARRAETKALVETHQMRRGVDVDGLARGLQHRAHEGHRRALAVGPGHVDDRRKPALRIAQRGKNAPHPVERQIDPLRMQRQQTLDDGLVGAHACGAGMRLLSQAGAGESTTGGRAGKAGRGGAFSVLVSTRHRLASVGRSMWRCTTMSTMP